VCVPRLTRMQIREALRCDMQYTNVFEARLDASILKAAYSFFSVFSVFAVVFFWEVSVVVDLTRALALDFVPAVFAFELELDPTAAPPERAVERVDRPVDAAGSASASVRLRLGAIPFRAVKKQGVGSA